MLYSDNLLLFSTIAIILFIKCHTGYIMYPLNPLGGAHTHLGETDRIRSFHNTSIQQCIQSVTKPYGPTTITNAITVVK